MDGITITQEDIELICKYADVKISGNSAESLVGKDYPKYLEIRKTMHKIIRILYAYYNTECSYYCSKSPVGNPVKIKGDKLQRIWFAFWTGDNDKHKAAQIYLSINPKEQCLDLGFSFGFGNVPLSLGQHLAKSVSQKKLNELKNDAFLCYKGQWSQEECIDNKMWHEGIRKAPSTYRILKHLSDEKYTFEKILSEVDKIHFLLKIFDNYEEKSFKENSHPLTLEERIKKLKIDKEIGDKGEQLVLKFEKERLKDLGISKKDYPKHVAKQSDTYGYDILSLDKSGNDIFIEVKSTNRKRTQDGDSFYMSSHEYEKMKKEESYKVYRVYDVNGKPEIFSLADSFLSTLSPIPSEYIIELKKDVKKIHLEHLNSE